MKREIPDDGRTIAPMNVPGMPWYDPARAKREAQKRREEPLRLTREERRAMLRALCAVLLQTALPIALIYVCGYLLLLAALERFWLN